MGIVDAVRLFSRADLRVVPCTDTVDGDILFHAVAGIVFRPWQSSSGKTLPARVRQDIDRESLFRRLIMHAGRHSMVLNTGLVGSPSYPTVVQTTSVTSEVVRYCATVYTQISPHEVWAQPVLVYSTLPSLPTAAYDSGRSSHCIVLPPTTGYPSVHYTAGSQFWDNHYGTIMADACTCFAVSGVFLLHEVDAYPQEEPPLGYYTFRHVRALDWLDYSATPMLPTITNWDTLTWVMNEAMQ